MIGKRKKYRILHWTCRKCGGHWDTKIRIDSDTMPTSDNQCQSICDECMDRLGPPKVVNRLLKEGVTDGN